jgi:hypothetical protein
MVRGVAADLDDLCEATNVSRRLLDGPDQLVLGEVV